MIAGAMASLPVVAGPGGGGLDPTLFAITVDTSKTGESVAGSFKIPSTNPGAYAFTWQEVNGAGSGSGTSSGSSHTIVTGVAPGLIKVFISPTGGLFTKFVFNNGGDKLKLISIEQWGSTAFEVVNGMFYNCDNFTTVTAIDTPNLSLLSDSSTTNMFRNTDVLTQINNLRNWNMSSVTTSREMFRDCIALDLSSEDIGLWNISSMTTMLLIAHNMTISPATYDKMLLGFSGQTVLPNVPFGPGATTKHTSAATAAKAILTGSPNNWVITDNGVV